MFEIFLSLITSILFYFGFLRPFNAIDILYIFLLFIGFLIAYLILYLLFIFVITLTINTKEEPLKASNFIQFVSASLSRKILFYTNTKVKIFGLEKLPSDTRFLIVSNHKNAFDPICYNYALKYYDVGFISKPENFKIPLIGRLVHREFYLPINRENDKEALKTILKAIKLCKNNVCSIGLYPEGTRNKTDKPLLEFKTGGLKIAQKANIPIVVSIIRNLNKVSFNPFKKSKIEIEIIDVIMPEDFDESTIALGDKIYNLMLENLNK